MSKQKSPLTRAQKQLVVSALMNSAGTIAEFWDETHPELEKVPAKRRRWPAPKEDEPVTKKAQSKGTQYMGRTILPTSSVEALGKYYVVREQDGMLLDESLCSQFYTIKAAKKAIKFGDVR